MFHQSIEDILDEENIREAIDSLRGKSGRAGTDGVSVAQLPDFWENNAENIKDSIRKNLFEPGVARQYVQLNKKGKQRKITVLNAVDRMLARAATQVLSPALDKCFSERCYGYRTGRSTKDVALFSAEQIEMGNQWVAVIDVSNFFDSLSHDILFRQLEMVIDDSCIMNLLRSFIQCRIETEEGQYRLAKGLLQGLSLSPLLSNIYLSTLDKELEMLYPGYCRYGDDIRIYTESQHQGTEIVSKCKELLLTLGLQCNEKKTGVFLATNKSCLGYDLIQKDGHVLVAPVVHSNPSIYHVWQKSALKEIDHNFHIVSDGILTKKDFTLLFEKDIIGYQITYDNII